ncbi:O-methyltransferase [Calothrix sp. NIES-4071]|nr:O-methyltransferase [Calothrix sp. NIES-4071]BAZ61075.1 O-methyltransferase [Calothrix sp. NIES-4105]
MKPPVILEHIQLESEALGFQMVSDPLTGSLLKTLAASKPGGTFLELGTGTGVSAAWLLDGMDEDSQLISIENDATVASVAKKYLGHDKRVKFQIEDAAFWLNQVMNQKFDLIFADAWVGKYSYLEQALGLLKPGGLYVVDDMLPQPNWPSVDHVSKVNELVSILENTEDLVMTKINWSSGIVIATKVKR